MRGGTRYGSDPSPEHDLSVGSGAMMRVLVGMGKWCHSVCFRSSGSAANGGVYSGRRRSRRAAAVSKKEKPAMPAFLGRPRLKKTAYDCLRLRGPAELALGRRSGMTTIDAAQRLKTVHPRVGGEHVAESVKASVDTGSSPRGRGTLWLSEWSWASSTVHPRVGGEHLLQEVSEGALHGSSPRGRGTPNRSEALLLVVRFIPAWAGNTTPVAGCP